ncbi:leucine-rich repeat protein [Plasmodium vinckei vinckei]|uniref:Leucine-rich repeat protein n=1 Tax=Plasmodium vinckei vinckei TaxID=54757 RepID=A0A449BTM3_PLAVN|nr:leucine-rich repeat protein [Plasmodium vinckei vinckei]VEV56830.1 leucine-rich repeat protein [Plasmodium vinckei vinckei]
MEQGNDDNLLKLIKCSNNVESKKNEEIETLEICMEKSINLNIFDQFKNIKELYLIKNNITDISPLFKCVNLEILFLQINQIESILGIKSLVKLEKLNLFNNKLTEKFINIEENENLTYIDLSDNEIENINFLSNTNNLVHINLANNKIKNLDPLKNNVYIEYLNVSGNRLEKFEDVQVLWHLSHLKELYLSSIYYRNNVLVNSILYKHYFFNNFPNLQILDHEIILDKNRKITMRDMEVLKSIMDFKINLIHEKYCKEKYHILFINNKNICYLNNALKPFHSYSNIEEFLQINNDKKESILKIKEEINFLLSAYTSRFNYIMRRLKEEKNLQIKYITTSMNSYFNIFFKNITTGHDEYKKIEDFIKLMFKPETLKNYFIDDIKIENIIKVKKLNHGQLDEMIENHLNSLIYEKKLLFLHPYNYCKINNFYEFDDEEKTSEDTEKKKFFEKNYVCSCYNINHILKTLIKLYLEEDRINDLVHLIYYKKKKEDYFVDLKNDINIKKKIMAYKKLDFLEFPIYIIETYLFPSKYKEISAYSSQEHKANEKKGDKENEDQNVKESKFKIYYTLPVHTNLKYIVNVSLINKNKEKISDKPDINKSNYVAKIEKEKSKKKNFLEYVKMRKTNANSIENNKETTDKPSINSIYFNDKIKEQFLQYALDFDSVNFFNITKYFIKLSKVICEIRKNLFLLFFKEGIKSINNIDNVVDNSENNIHMKEKVELISLDDLEIVKKKKKEESLASDFPLPSIGQDNDDNDNETNKKKVDTLFLNNLNLSKISLKLLCNKFKNLKELYLKNNNIHNLNHFFQYIEEYDMENLEILDLSFNCIFDITPIYNKFKKLIHFDMSYNYLYDYKQIMNFSVNHQKIQYLSIKCNSIYFNQNYYDHVHILFPSIKKFNDIELVNKPDLNLRQYCFLEADLENDIHYAGRYINKNYGNKTIQPRFLSETAINEDIITMPGHQKLYKGINLNNYKFYVKKIDLSSLYIKFELANLLNFSTFPKLEVLNLSNNGIENLSNLKLPEKLKVLNLKNNKIVCIDNFINGELCCIEKIILDNNEIKNIDKINMLKNLKILRCSYNKISNIPILNNLKLIEINIHNNLIKDITNLILIKNKKQLVLLNIYNNKINFSNRDLYLTHIFPNLLILNNNYVERKIDTRKFFKSVYTLDIFFEIYNIYPPYTSLKVLEIKNLKIKNILFNINNDNFKNLEILDISNNYINTIKNLGPLDNLKVLILNNNKHINEDSFICENKKNVLNSFKSLQELDIGFCIISKTCFFKNCENLQNLKTLNLEGNNINLLKYLNCLKNLEILNLANNKISKVCSNSFPSALKNLNISNNLIRNLSEFCEMGNLEILDLRVNRIDNIDEFKHLKNLNKLKELYLSGNRKIKENFITIKDILNQVKYFDIRIIKEQENIKHEIEEKMERNVTPKNEINKKTTLTTAAKNKSTKLLKKVPIKNTQLKGVVKNKNNFDTVEKKDDFVVIGKKITSKGNY